MKNSKAAQIFLECGFSQWAEEVHLSAVRTRTRLASDTQTLQTPPLNDGGVLLDSIWLGSRVWRRLFLHEWPDTVKTWRINSRLCGKA